MHADAFESALRNLDEGGEHIVAATHAFATDAIWTTDAAHAVTPGAPELLAAAGNLVMAYGALAITYVPGDPPPSSGLLPVLFGDRIRELNDVGPRQAASHAIEPLLGAAQAMLDTGSLGGEDEAELRSLIDALRAEWLKPRPDALSLERLTVRLARRVAELEASFANEGALDGDVSLQALRQIVDAADLGLDDDAADNALAERFIARLWAVLGPRIDEVAQRALDQDPPLAGRIDQSDQRRETSSRLPAQIAIGVAGNLVFAILQSSGILGHSVGAILWILIAIHNLFRSSLGLVPHRL